MDKHFELLKQLNEGMKSSTVWRWAPMPNMWHFNYSNSFQLYVINRHSTFPCLMNASCGMRSKSLRCVAIALNPNTMNFSGVIRISHADVILHNICTINCATPLRLTATHGIEYCAVSTVHHNCYYLMTRNVSDDCVDVGVARVRSPFLIDLLRSEW